MDEIDMITYVIACDNYTEGTYRLSCNTKTRSGGYLVTDHHTKLSYTEAIDVLLCYLDENRPGRRVGADGVQPPLW